MRIRTATLAAAVLALVVAMPASAAGNTVRSTGSATSDVVPIVGLCDVTVYATLHQSWVETDHFAPDGTLVSANVLVDQHMDFTANHTTLSSVPTHVAVTLAFDADWNPTSWIEHGVLVRFALPDGGSAVWAGRLDDMTGMGSGAVTLARVCPYLA